MLCHYCEDEDSIGWLRFNNNLRIVCCFECMEEYR